MKWTEIQRQFPDRWVLLNNFSWEDGVRVDGDVVGTASSQQELVMTSQKLAPHYPNLAIQFTGALLSESDLPILWRISHTHP